jgi:hypothetical protein
MEWPMFGWFKSKTNLSAIAVAVVGVCTAAGVQIPDGVLEIAGALGLIGVRHAIHKQSGDS